MDKIAAYDARKVGEVEIPFIPGRVVLQDFTGVPAIVDLAAMRSAIVRMTGDDDSGHEDQPGGALVTSSSTTRSRSTHSTALTPW